MRYIDDNFGTIPAWLKPGKIIRSNGAGSMWFQREFCAVDISDNVPLLIIGCGRQIDSYAALTLTVINPEGEVYEDTAVLTYLTSHYAQLGDK